MPQGLDAPARVSVVIPVWDSYGGDTLLGALASVRRQNAPVRTVVVDNASSVPLPSLGDAEVVRLAHRVSTGAARNASLGLLSTPYVVFLDADDRLLDGTLSWLIAGLDADPRRTTHTLSIIEAATGTRHRSPRRLARVLSAAPPLFALANAIWSLLPTQGCTIMRVPDVVACGGYADSSTGEDWVLATSLCFRGLPSFDERPGLLYRQRANSPGVRAPDRSTLVDNARRVRHRIAADPAAPRYVKALLPLIAAAQWCVACLLHPAYRKSRAALTRQ